MKYLKLKFKNTGGGLFEGGGLFDDAPIGDVPSLNEPSDLVTFCQQFCEQKDFKKCYEFFLIQGYQSRNEESRKLGQF